MAEIARDERGELLVKLPGKLHVFVFEAATARRQAVKMWQAGADWWA